MKKTLEQLYHAEKLMTNQYQDKYLKEKRDADSLRSELADARARILDLERAIDANMAGRE